MKFLHDQFQDFFDSAQSARYIFLNEDENYSLETGESEDGIDSILDRPLEFSIRQLQTLEKASGQMTEAQKQKFRDLIGYYLGLVSSGQESIPPRILLQMQVGSLKLFSFLGLETQRRIRMVTLDQREKLRKALEKSNKWTPAEVARVCGLYRFLQSKAVKKDGAFDPLFLEVKEKLIQKAIPLAYQFEVAEGGEVSESIDKVLGNTQEVSLNGEQKLLLLEIHRLFPSAKDWGTTFTFNRWRDLTTSVGNDLLKWESEEKSPEENNPNYMLAWELLDNLIHELSSDDPELEPLRAQTEKIIRLVKRGNATQFLAFARKQDVLLPVHLDILKEIQSNRDNFLVDHIGERQWLETVQSPELQKLKKEKRAVQKEKERLENEAFQRALEEGTTNDVSENYQNIKAEKETLEQELKTNLLTRVREEFIPALEEQTKRAVEAESEESKKQRIQGDSDYRKERILSISEEAEKIVNEEGDLSSTDVKVFVKRLEKELEAVSREKIVKIDFIDDFKESANSYAEKTSSLKQTEASLRDQTPFTEDLKAKLKDYSDRIQEIEIQEWKELREDTTFRELNDYFLRPQEIAKEIENDYWQKLEGRIQNHQVRSADLAVIDDTAFSPSNDKVNTEREKLIEFRRAYKQALTLQLEKIEREGLLKKNIVGEGEDRYAPWFEVLDRELSHTKLKAVLQENLHYNIREHFENDQIVSELLEGAQQYYRTEISDRLSRIILPEHQQEFFRRWERLNQKVENPAEIGLLNADLNQALTLKTNTRTKVEGEKQTFSALLENIETQNEGGIENGKKEKEKLESVFDVQKKRLLWGQTVSEDGQEMFIPGKEGLIEATVQTREYRNSIKKSIDPFFQKLPHIQQEFFKIYKGGAQEKENILTDLQAELKELFPLWKARSRQLRSSVREMQTICEEIFSKSFADQFFATVIKLVDKLDVEFAEMQSYAQEKNFVLTGEESFFETIEEGLRIFDSFTNFRDGFWARESRKLDKRFEENNKGIRYLKELKFFDDSTSNKENFQKKFENIRSEFLGPLNEYEKNIRAIQRIIDRDKNLKDEDFYKKFGFERSYIQNIINQHKEQDKKFFDIWGKFQDSGFLGNWLEQYNANEESRADAIAEFAELERITETAKDVAKSSSVLKEWLDEYDKNHKSVGIYGRLKNTQWQSFSIYDIYRTIKESFEKHEMNWKRDSDRAVATLGVQVLGTGNNFLGRIGQRFKQMGEESESQRIKEFETQYHDQNGWVVREVLYKTNNADEARACINLLKEKGFMRWDDPMLWRTLMRLQGGTIFNIPEDMKLSAHNILEKVKSACETIWTRDVFRQWHVSFDGDLKKAKDGFVHEFGTYENDDKPRLEILSGMLKRWSQGNVEEVDPARYECFIFESFRQGKMNGQPDKRWYYLVQGLSVINPRTGQSLLPRDVLMRLNGEFLGRFPHLDFLSDKDSPKLKGKIVPDGTPGATKRPWNYDDYLEWGKMMGTANGTFDPNDTSTAGNTERFFYQVVRMSPFAQQRIQRMARLKDEPDHDDGVNYQADWDQEQAVQALSRESNGSDKYSYDFWRSYLSGFDKMVRYTKEYIDDRDLEWGALPSWQKERTRLLLELGNNLKSTLTVTQTLQGNFHGASSRGSTVFNDHEWNEDSAYSIHAEKSRTQVNRFMGNMFQKAGEDSRFQEILDFKSSDKYGQNFDNRKNQPEWKEKNKVVGELLSEQYGTEKYFTNANLIEQALNEYCAVKG